MRSKNLENDLETNDEGCKATKEIFETSISEYSHTLMNAQTGLADATSEEVNANVEAKLLAQQIADLETEMAHIRSDCQTNINALVLEVCGIKSIRIELYKMIEQSAISRIASCPSRCRGSAVSLTRAERRMILSGSTHVQEVLFLLVHTASIPCTGKVFAVEMHHQRVDFAHPGVMAD